MELEEAKVLLRGGLEAIKKLRLVYPYSSQSMVPIATIFRPHEPAKIIGLAYRDDEEKRMMQLYMQQELRSSHAVGVMLASDMRWTTSEMLAQVFPHLIEFQKHSLAEWKKEYLKLLEKHGGRLQDLPREAWGEGVTAAIKGPGITPMFLTQRYKEGPNDSIEFFGDPRENAMELAEFNTIKDWW
jgi:hypothetical protein